MLSGQITVAEAARKENISKQSIDRWKAEFLETGKAALVAGKSGPSTQEEQLKAQVEYLILVLSEAAVTLQVWRTGAEGRLGLCLSKTLTSSDPRRERQH